MHEPPPLPRREPTTRCHECGIRLPESEMTRVDVVVGRTTGYGSLWPTDPGQRGGYGHYSASQRGKVDLCPDCYDLEMRRREHSRKVIVGLLIGLGVAFVLGMFCVALMLILSRS